MEKKTNYNQQHTGGVTDKKDDNAGSANFNQGSEQDPNYNKGTKVSDKEKATGHADSKGKSKDPGKTESGK